MFSHSLTARDVLIKLPVPGKVHFRQEIRQITVRDDANRETPVDNRLGENHAGVNLQIQLI